MTHPTVFFWQPKFDFLTFLQSSILGRGLIIILNYLIWLFLFVVAFLLIKNDPNFFWQILFATIIAETIEKFIKAKVFWTRPMFKRHHQVPAGLVESWYLTGSFPSGHTLKTTFFFLMVLQSGIIGPILFLAITLPLLIFRVIVGFHYPVDLLGGSIIGLFIWLICRLLLFPDLLNNFIATIFHQVFFFLL